MGNRWRSMTVNLQHSSHLHILAGCPPLSTAVQSIIGPYCRSAPYSLWPGQSPAQGETHQSAQRESKKEGKKVKSVR